MESESRGERMKEKAIKTEEEKEGKEGGSAEDGNGDKQE